MCNHREVRHLTDSWAVGQTIPFPTLREQFPTLDLNNGIMPLWTTLRDAGYRLFSHPMPTAHVNPDLVALMARCLPDYSTQALNRVAINLQTYGLAKTHALHTAHIQKPSLEIAI